MTYEQTVEQARKLIIQDEAVKKFLQAPVLQMGDAQSPYNF
jgi:hypothetical protein